MTLTPPPLQYLHQANAFDLLLLQPSRSLQRLFSVTARASPLRAPSVSIAPSQPRPAQLEIETSACDFVTAPRSIDVTLDFRMDLVFLLLFV